MGELVTLERDRDEQNAKVLVVACTAQTPERPHYGIFTRRQINSVRTLGVGCDVLSIAGFKSPLAYAYAARMLARLSLPDVPRYALIHAHGGEAALAATVYRRAPLVVSYQGSDVLGSPDADGSVPGWWRVRSRAVRLQSHAATRIIIKSAPMLAALPEGVWDRAEVIPNGVDLTRFTPRSRGRARAALGWDPDRRVVLFASDPSRPSKRPELARAACEMAARTVGDLRLEVAHGLPPEVMPTLMNASDCLLHPSASEGSPNVVKEALACNLPIVATPVGDIPELLAGVSESYVCEPDVRTIANALVRCLTPLRRSNGRRFAGRLDEGVIARRVLAVYSSVAQDIDHGA